MEFIVAEHIEAVALVRGRSETTAVRGRIADSRR
jgi:hypothetical protein